LALEESRGDVAEALGDEVDVAVRPWNVTGQPAVSVPVGIGAHNLPRAIQLAGRVRDETTLLALASQIEAAHPFPRWSPTAALRPDD
jgi:amidase